MNKKYTFGKKIVIIDTFEDTIKNYLFANESYEEIVYTMSEINVENEIKLDFLTEDHKKDFIETDVVALLQECFIQKKAIQKVLETIHVSIKDLWEIEYCDYPIALKYYYKYCTIEKFEKELLFFLSDWI